MKEIEQIEVKQKIELGNGNVRMSCLLSSTNNNLPAICFSTLESKREIGETIRGEPPPPCFTTVFVIKNKEAIEALEHVLIFAKEHFK